MPRQRRGGGGGERVRGDGEPGLGNGGLATDVEPIELIDPSAAPATTSELVGADGGVSRTVGLAIAIVAVLGVAILALSSNPEESALPPSTTEPADDDVRQVGDALVGPGPDLAWGQIIWTIGTGDFRWIDGAFVGDDGVTEWSIRPGIVGPSIGQRQSALTGRPDYIIVDSEGSRVLAPRSDQPDHLLFFGPDPNTDPIRVDLPVRSPVTDLVVRRARVQAAVVANTAVVVLTRSDELNAAALGERIGWDLTGRQPSVTVFDDRLEVRVSEPDEEAVNGTITVSFDEVEFTATELSALRPRVTQVELMTIDLAATTTGPTGIVPNRSADISVSGNRFVLEWANDDRVERVSTSVDGRSWHPSSPAEGLADVDGDATSIVATEGATWDIARSSDGGLTWQYTPEPWAKYELTAAGDVVVARQFTSGQDGYDGTDRYEVDLDDYELVIIGGGRSFELLDPTTGEVVSSGTITDSASGAAYDPFGNGLLVTDPADGETLSVTQSQLLFAYATTGLPLDETPLVAITEWDGASMPEWRIEPIDQIFGPDALRVHFVSGDGSLLAIVSTADGYDFYLADVS